MKYFNGHFDKNIKNRIKSWLNPIKSIEIKELTKKLKSLKINKNKLLVVGHMHIMKNDKLNGSNIIIDIDKPWMAGTFT